MANPSVILDVGADTTQFLRSINAASAQAQKSIKPMTFQIDTRSAKYALGQITGNVNEFNKSLAASSARVIAFGASVGVLRSITDSFKALVSQTVIVEKNLQDINVIFNLSSKALKDFGSSLFEVQRLTASGFTEVTDAAKEFSRQGLSVQETLKRTKDAMILVRLTGLDAAQAVQQLTATVNGFSGSALDTTKILNKLVNVDQNFSVSAKDLTEALSRAGSAAQDAGVSFEEFLAITTAVQQRTARGGAVIGNALKTIFSAVQRDTVVKQLKQLNVQIDESQTGMERLVSVAKAVESASPANANKIRELVGGGVRQINIVSAALKELTGAVGIYGQAWQKASENTDVAIQRNLELNKTLDALSKQSVASLNQALSKLGELGLSNNLKGLVSLFNGVLNTFNKTLDGTGIGGEFGKEVGESIARGLGNVLTGPVLVSSVMVLAKVLRETFKFGADVYKQLSQLNSNLARSNELQSGIGSVLSKNSGEYVKQLNSAKSKTDQERILLEILRQEVAQQEQLNARMREYAAIASKAGYSMQGGRVVSGPVQTKKTGVTTANNGLIPSIVQESAAIKKGVGGAMLGDRPTVIPNFNFGLGRKGPVVVHTGEKIVENFMGSGGNAVFNRDMITSVGGQNNLSNFGKVKNISRGFVPNLVHPINKIRPSVASRNMNAAFEKGKFYANFYDEFRSTLTSKLADRNDQTLFAKIYASVSSGDQDEKAVQRAVEMFNKVKREGFTSRNANEFKSMVGPKVKFQQVELALRNQELSSPKLGQYAKALLDPKELPPVDRNVIYAYVGGRDKGVNLVDADVVNNAADRKSFESHKARARQLKPDGTPRYKNRAKMSDAALLREWKADTKLLRLTQGSRKTINDSIIRNAARLGVTTQQYQAGVWAGTRARNKGALPSQILSPLDGLMQAHNGYIPNLAKLKFKKELPDERGKSHLLALDSDNKSIGSLSYYDYPKEKSISFSAVSPENRGKGIARKLFRKLGIEAFKNRKTIYSDSLIKQVYDENGVQAVNNIGGWSDILKLYPQLKYRISNPEDALQFTTALEVEASAGMKSYTNSFESLREFHEAVSKKGYLSNTAKALGRSQMNLSMLNVSNLRTTPFLRRRKGRSQTMLGDVVPRHAAGFVPNLAKKAKINHLPGSKTGSLMDTMQARDENDQLLGSLDYFINSRNGLFDINYLEVKPPFRGTGVARELFYALGKKAVKKDFAIYSGSFEKSDMSMPSVQTWSDILELYPQVKYRISNPEDTLQFSTSLGINASSGRYDSFKAFDNLREFHDYVSKGGLKSLAGEVDEPTLQARHLKVFDALTTSFLNKRRKGQPPTLGDVVPRHAAGLIPNFSNDKRLKMQRRALVQGAWFKAKSGKGINELFASDESLAINMMSEFANIFPNIKNSNANLYTALQPNTDLDEIIKQFNLRTYSGGFVPNFSGFRDVRVYRNDLTSQLKDNFLKIGLQNNPTQPFIGSTIHAIQRAKESGRINYPESLKLNRIKELDIDPDLINFINFSARGNAVVPNSFGYDMAGIPGVLINSLPMSIRNELMREAIREFGTREGVGVLLKTILTRGQGGIYEPPISGNKIVSSTDYHDILTGRDAARLTPMYKSGGYVPNMNADIMSAIKTMRRPMDMRRYLQRMGIKGSSGSSRVFYPISETTGIKIAKNEMGRVQNEVEASVLGDRLVPKSVVPEMFEHDQDLNNWILLERGEKFNRKEAEQIIGGSYSEFVKRLSRSTRNIRPNPKKKIANEELLYDFESLIANFGLEDVHSTNLGIFNAPTGRALKMIDVGFNDDVARQYARRRRDKAFNTAMFSPISGGYIPNLAIKRGGYKNAIVGKNHVTISPRKKSYIDDFNEEVLMYAAMRELGGRVGFARSHLIDRGFDKERGLPFARITKAGNKTLNEMLTEHIPTSDPQGMLAADAFLSQQLARTMGGRLKSLGFTGSNITYKDPIKDQHYDLFGDIKTDNVGVAPASESNVAHLIQDYNSHRDVRKLWGSLSNVARTGKLKLFDYGFLTGAQSGSSASRALEKARMMMAQGAYDFKSGGHIPNLASGNFDLEEYKRLRDNARNITDSFDMGGIDLLKDYEKLSEGIYQRTGVRLDPSKRDGLNEGSARTFVPLNDKYGIKVAKSLAGLGQNLVESEILGSSLMRRKYGDILPRLYANDPRGLYSVVERGIPLSARDELPTSDPRVAQVLRKDIPVNAENVNGMLNFVNSMLDAKGTQGNASSQDFAFNSYLRFVNKGGYWASKTNLDEAAIKKAATIYDFFAENPSLSFHDINSSNSGLFGPNKDNYKLLDVGLNREVGRAFYSSGISRGKVAPLDKVLNERPFLRYAANPSNIRLSDGFVPNLAKIPIISKLIGRVATNLIDPSGGFNFSEHVGRNRNVGWKKIISSIINDVPSYNINGNAFSPDIIKNSLPTTQRNYAYNEFAFRTMFGLKPREHIFGKTPIKKIKGNTYAVKPDFKNDEFIIEPTLELALRRSSGAYLSSENKPRIISQNQPFGNFTEELDVDNAFVVNKDHRRSAYVPSEFIDTWDFDLHSKEKKWLSPKNVLKSIAESEQVKHLKAVFHEGRKDKLLDSKFFFRSKLWPALKDAILSPMSVSLGPPRSMSSGANVTYEGDQLPSLLARRAVGAITEPITVVGRKNKRLDKYLRSGYDSPSEYARHAWNQANTQHQIESRLFALSDGFIPNLSLDPLNESIMREASALKSLGYSTDQIAKSIKVGSSSILKSSKNPSGLGVYNSIQESSLGHAFGLHSGENLKTAGAVPNFASPRLKNSKGKFMSSKDVDMLIQSYKTNPTEENLSAILAASKSLPNTDLVNLLQKAGISKPFDTVNPDRVKNIISQAEAVAAEKINLQAFSPPRRSTAKVVVKATAEQEVNSVVQAQKLEKETEKRLQLENNLRARQQAAKLEQERRVARSTSMALREDDPESAALFKGQLATPGLVKFETIGETQKKLEDAFKSKKIDARSLDKANSVLARDLKRGLAEGISEYLVESGGDVKKALKISLSKARQVSGGNKMAKAVIASVAESEDAVAEVFSSKGLKAKTENQAAAIRRQLAFRKTVEQRLGAGGISGDMSSGTPVGGRGAFASAFYGAIPQLDPLMRTKEFKALSSKERKAISEQLRKENRANVNRRYGNIGLGLSFGAGFAAPQLLEAADKVQSTGLRTTLGAAGGALQGLSLGAALGPQAAAAGAVAGAMYFGVKAISGAESAFRKMNEELERTIDKNNALVSSLSSYIQTQEQFNDVLSSGKALTEGMLSGFQNQLTTIFNTIDNDKVKKELVAAGSDTYKQQEVLAKIQNEQNQLTRVQKLQTSLAGTRASSPILSAFGFNRIREEDKKSFIQELVGTSKLNFRSTNTTDARNAERVLQILSNKDNTTSARSDVIEVLKAAQVDSKSIEQFILATAGESEQSFRSYLTLLDESVNNQKEAADALKQIVDALDVKKDFEILFNKLDVELNKQSQLGGIGRNLQFSLAQNRVNSVVNPMLRGHGEFTAAAASSTVNQFLLDRQLSNSLNTQQDEFKSGLRDIINKAALPTDSSEVLARNAALSSDSADEMIKYLDEISNGNKEQINSLDQLRANNEVANAKILADNKVALDAEKENFKLLSAELKRNNLLKAYGGNVFGFSSSGLSGFGANTDSRSGQISYAQSILEYQRLFPSVQAPSFWTNAVSGGVGEQMTSNISGLLNTMLNKRIEEGQINYSDRERIMGIAETQGIGAALGDSDITNEMKEAIQPLLNQFEIVRNEIAKDALKTEDDKIAEKIKNGLEAIFGQNYAKSYLSTEGLRTILKDTLPGILNLGSPSQSTPNGLSVKQASVAITNQTQANQAAELKIRLQAIDAQIRILNEFLERNDLNGLSTRDINKLRAGFSQQLAIPDQIIDINGVQAKNKREISQKQQTLLQNMARQQSDKAEMERLINERAELLKKIADGNVGRSNLQNQGPVTWKTQNSNNSVMWGPDQPWVTNPTSQSAVANPVNITAPKSIYENIKSGDTLRMLFGGDAFSPKEWFPNNNILKDKNIYANKNPFAGIDIESYINNAGFSKERGIIFNDMFGEQGQLRAIQSSLGRNFSDSNSILNSVMERGDAGRNTVSALRRAYKAALSLDLPEAEKEKIKASLNQLKTDAEKQFKIKISLEPSVTNDIRTGLRSGFGKLKDYASDTEDITQAWESMPMAINEAFSSAVVSSVQNMKTLRAEGKSVADAIKDSFRESLSNTFAQMGQMYMMKGMAGIMGNMGNAFSSLNFSSGHSIPSLAHGGEIKGKVPALTMGGEFAVQPEAVKFYGSDFFEKLNKGQIKIGAPESGKITGGSGHSDDVLGAFRQGTFIVNKGATAKYGVDTLEALNNGALSGKADGGKIKKAFWGALLGYMLQGAIVGALGSAITGGDIGKGALLGAAGGALGGAMSGGLSTGNASFGQQFANTFNWMSPTPATSAPTSATIPATAPTSISSAPSATVAAPPAATAPGGFAPGFDMNSVGVKPTSYRMPSTPSATVAAPPTVKMGWGDIGAQLLAGGGSMAVSALMAPSPKMPGQNKQQPEIDGMGNITVYQGSRVKHFQISDFQNIGELEKAIGADNMKLFGITDTRKAYYGGLIRRQSGGSVDDVPLLARDGEFVLTPEGVENIGGVENGFKANKGFNISSSDSASGGEEGKIVVNINVYNNGSETTADVETNTQNSVELGQRIKDGALSVILSEQRSQGVLHKDSNSRRKR